MSHIKEELVADHKEQVVVPPTPEGNAPRSLTAPLGDLQRSVPVRILNPSAATVKSL